MKKPKQRPAKKPIMEPLTLYTIVDADGRPVSIDGWDVVACTKARNVKREIRAEDGEHVVKISITEVK